MEKCSFCVQRIQEAKAEARARGAPLRDGDIQTACQQSCPTQAIVFGDLNDPESRVARLAGSPRAYGVLEELNVRPRCATWRASTTAPRAEADMGAELDLLNRPRARRTPPDARGDAPRAARRR